MAVTLSFSMDQAIRLKMFSKYRELQSGMGTLSFIDQKVVRSHERLASCCSWHRDVDERTVKLAS